MELVEAFLNGVLLIKPHIFGDERGYFKDFFGK